VVARLLIHPANLGYRPEYAGLVVAYRCSSPLGDGGTDELVTWSLAHVGVWGLLADGQTFLIDIRGYAEADSRRKT